MLQTIKERLSYIKMENKNVIFDFYNNGAEIGLLENGLGMVEFYRSKEIISQYIPKASTVYDIGGGLVNILNGLLKMVTMLP